MATPENQAPETESATDALIPTFDVDTATVSVADGMWQDQPDNVASFVEARLGDLGRGRGNLYICLDVSGEVEGRSDVERALIEVLRDTYATSRGSISFGLSESLRAANAYLFEANRQVAREGRRMAGISAVVLRGNDLYIAQAGPAVVYVEASEKLDRYPVESDWFVEDSPLFSPEGNASAPLGIRREFASDLAHTSISAGDVFVLATRALTQLATTEELAIAFTERSAQEIARHLEELGEDVDLTALIVEIMDPQAHGVVDRDESGFVATGSPVADKQIESLPVPLAALVPLDESEPPLEDGTTDEKELSPEEDDQEESDAEWQEAPSSTTAAANAGEELNWDDQEADDTEAEESPEESDSKPLPQPVYAAAAAAMPRMSAPAFTPPPPRPPTGLSPSVRSPVSPQPSGEEWDAESERRRAERASRRATQKESVDRAVGGVAGSLLMFYAAIGGAFSRLFGVVDWDSAGKRTNRFLNLGVGALITFVLLLIRLVLPGAAPRSTSILPRRATSDPVWLKALALALPLLFVGLAFGRYMVEVGNRTAQLEALVAQADGMVKQAEVNPDKVKAREQLNDALKTIQEAQTLKDTQKARGVLYRIQDQLDEIDGVSLIYFLPAITELGGGQFKQISASDKDVFLLDGRGRVYHYVVNDASGEAEPAANEGLLLQLGDKVGDKPVEALQLMGTAAPAQNKAVLIAITKDAVLSYDLEAEQWTVTTVTDSDKWGDLRALDSFGGNIYLLDAKNNQIYRYTPNGKGYSTEGTPYFPQNTQPVLNKAIDMAIDGDVWVLNDNGTVLRFRAGVPIPFELSGLTTPLKKPVAIFTRPEVDAVYIADAGNQRIVEFDKNGAFVRQFKPSAEKSDEFQNLQDFTVNETKRKLYLANPTSAYMVNVPK